MAQLTAGLMGTAKLGRRGGRPAIACALLFLLMLSTAGCVEQLLSMDSDPSGAVVTLNDQEVGRTPVTTNFKWYGYYEVNVRKDGYQTLKTTSPVIAPWWQWVPIDLIAEILPIHLTDQHFLHFTLQPITAQLNDPNRLLRQGERLRAELEAGANEPRARPTKPVAATRSTSGAKAATEPSTGTSTEP
jgi:hypothetical protein